LEAAEEPEPNKFLDEYPVVLALNLINTDWLTPAVEILADKLITRSVKVLGIVENTILETPPDPTVTADPI
jgi:hypothetical protein